MTTAPSPARVPRLVRRELVLLDYVFLGLGLTSIIILGLDIAGGLHPGEAEFLYLADYAAVGLFGLTFAGRFFTADNPLRYLRSHWFAIFGFLPLTTPVLVPDRFYVVIQVLIVASRFGQAIDRAFGAHVLQQLFLRYRAAVLEEITDPILDQLLFILQINLVKGRYMASLGDGLDKHRPEIRGAVERAIQASPKMRTVNRIPGVEEAIHNTIMEAVDAAVAALQSDELNHAVQQTLNEAFEDLRKQVKSRSWVSQGVGIKDVATGLVRGTA